MKYLKKYKIFESIDFDELEEVLKDIFIDLVDDGFAIKVKNSKSNFGKGTEFMATYDISIFDEKNINDNKKRKTLKLSDIFEYILMAESYMDEDGWYLNYIHTRSRGNKFTDLNSDDIEIYKKGYNDILDIEYVNILFKRKYK